MNFDLDSTTIIAGVLGFFFLVVAMFKTFIRRNGSQVNVPGARKSQKEDEEVKLSDPFLSTKPTMVKNGTAEPEKTHPSVPAKTHLSANLSPRSAFKQFSTDVSVDVEAKIRDDSDYQWE